MNKLVLILGTALALIVQSQPLVAADAEASSTGCDRSCLYGIAEQYFAALEAHNPALVPAIRLVKFTENGVRMPLGDGVWNTISARRGYNLRVADVPRGQVAVFEVIEEHGVPSLLAVRFRIANRQIVEIETVVSRSIDDSQFSVAGNLMTPNPLWSTPLEEAQRQPRERLISAVDGYFNTLQKNSGELLTRFTEDCNRFENGRQVTNDLQAPLHDAASKSCSQQFELGHFADSDRVRNRRYPLIDQEMGVVLAATFVDYTGKIVDFQWNDGTPQKSRFFHPHSSIRIELFRIEDNAIRLVESVFAGVPYNMPSVW